MSTVALALKGVNLSFAGVPVLKGVDLDLQMGEIHALVGENGAGKSSLAKIAAGVYRPQNGEIFLEGKSVRFSGPKQALGMGVALIHQEPLTFPDLNVAENIFVGHHPKRGGLINWGGMRQEAEKILAGLGVNLHPGDEVSSLSVAKQQMVELACAMSHNPRVFIFDETTAPLTPKEADELFVVMRALRDRGCAVAMVTHHMEEIWAVTDRITVLRDGAKVGEFKPTETTIGEVINLMVGRELQLEHFPKSEAVGETVLELQNYSGPGFRAINLTVNEGEVVCLAGLVGAGRTELLRCIFGAAPQTSGELKIGGKLERPRNPSHAIQLGIALAPEDRRRHGLSNPHSVEFNSTLPHLDKLNLFGWVLSKPLREISQLFSKRLNLASRGPQQPVEQLSGGNQQKVVLSKWLMTEPKLLLLDEPTRGVDVGAKSEVHRLIRELASRNLAILVASSDLPEVLALADRILVMRGGTIVAELDGKTATQEQVMHAASGAGEVHAA